MTGKIFEILPRDGIPQTDGLIPTPTCKDLTIWTEGDALNLSCMPGERPLVFARGNIPQTDGLVRTPACEGRTIRTESNTIDRTWVPINCRRMPYKCPLVFTCDGIPQTDGIVPTSACKSLTIRTESNAIALRLMSLKSMKFFTGLCIAYQDPNRTCGC